MGGGSEEFRVPVGGTYMTVIRFGQGTKCFVMLPGVSLTGLSGMGEAVAGAYQAIAETYTVYLIDYRHEAVPDCTVQDLAEDVYHVMKVLGIRAADVYGVSLGGMTAQVLALKHPECVHKAVVCSAMCCGNELIYGVAKEWIRTAEQGDVIAMNRCFFRTIYSEKFRKMNREALKAAETVGTEEDLERLRILTGTLLKFDISAEVGKIECPVLVLGDEEDRVTGAEGARLIAEKIGCELYLYRGYGHAVYDEAPDIKERILKFLTDEAEGENSK